MYRVDYTTAALLTGSCIPARYLHGSSYQNDVLPRVSSYQSDVVHGSFIPEGLCLQWCRSGARPGLAVACVH